MKFTDAGNVEVGEIVIVHTATGVHVGRVKYVEYSAAYADVRIMTPTLVICVSSRNCQRRTWDGTLFAFPEPDEQTIRPRSYQEDGPA